MDGVKRMNALTALLDLFGMWYVRIDDFEIMIECPADVVPPKFFYETDFETQDIINHPKVSCLTDEAKIFIKADENGDLNWLIGLPNYSEEED